MQAFENLSMLERDNYTVATNNYAQDVDALIKGTAQIWRSGLTFRQACDISVLYLQGILPTAPYHLGPLSSETNNVSTLCQRCTRLGLLTVSSEPVQQGISIVGERYKVSNASVLFWIKKHNVPTLLRYLDENRFSIKLFSSEDNKFSSEFGESYRIEDNHTESYFVTDLKPDTNELFEIIWLAAKEFTDLPLHLLR